MMMPMNPHMVHMQKLAVATWFEQDEAVAKFIFTSLKSLAHIKITDVPAASRMTRLVEKAATVLPLAKPFPGILSSTFNHFYAEMLSNLGVGYLTHTAVSHTGHTHVFYHKLHRFFMHATDVPLEFAVQVGGGKNVVLETLRALSATSANWRSHHRLRRLSRPSSGAGLTISSLPLLLPSSMRNTSLQS